jgi:hypothetical protein
MVRAGAVKGPKLPWVSFHRTWQCSGTGQGWTAKKMSAGELPARKSSGTLEMSRGRCRAEGTGFITSALLMLLPVCQQRGVTAPSMLISRQVVPRNH